MYKKLPTKFDYRTYYLQQAAGGSPAFPVFRARQRGGFLAPLLKRHGIPFLRWIGRQAASLATGVGNSYLDKGSLSKADMKELLKNQGKKTAKSALDAIRQQVGGGGAGNMNVRRDARLSSLVPLSTRKREGTLTPFHGVRSSFPSEMHEGASGPIPFHSAPVKRRRSNKRKTVKSTHKKTLKKKKKKKQTPKGKSSRKKKSKKLNKGLLAIRKSSPSRKKKIPKGKIPPNTIFS